jgi:predicted PurR-regulated permease PerM
VTTLRRYRVKKVLAVMVVVTGALLIVAGFTSLISWQITALVQELPDHRDKISAKLLAVQEWIGGDSPGRFSAFVRDIERMVKPKPPGDSVAIPVEMVDRPAGLLSRLEFVLGPAIEVMAGGLFTIVLFAFLLYSKEDMRNRFLRLLGPRRLTATTKAVDDAGMRISRYLRAQLIINVAFGAVLTLALLLLGVKYAILWGFVAAVLRYIPYIGAWIGLIPPMLASIAMTHNWWQPLSVLAIYGLLELIVANVAEPRMFGHSLGISEVAQLVSAAFWAFLWGPIGLILSGPITACMLVIGKNSRQLRCLETLLGTEQALPPSLTYFQRLTARDRDEAWHIASTFVAANSADTLADGLLLPALARTQSAVEAEDLTPEDGQWIATVTEEVADDFQALTSAEPVDGDPVSLLVVAAGEIGDTVAANMLVARLPRDRWQVHSLTEGALASEALAAVREHQPAAIVVVSLDEGALLQTRYLCKRIRSVQQGARLIVGRFGLGPVASDVRKELSNMGVDHVVDGLDATQKLLETNWTMLSAAAEIDEHPSRRREIGTASAL